MKHHGKILCLSAGAFCILASLITLLVFGLPTAFEESFTFTSVYQGESTTLRGSYREGEGEYAALICPGFSCDRQKWRPMSNLFVKNGVTAMRFDYSGQGGSLGTIGFDNAKTDHIPTEIADALKVLHEKSGVDYDHIILVGHSMGGRSILRYLYNHNAGVEGFEIPVKNVILFSPEVNYHYNAQASLFAGTTDADEYPWNEFSPESVQGTNVYLFGSTADDIVSDEDVWSLFARMGGEINWESGKIDYIKQGNLCLGITTGVLHSYQMYSGKFGAFANQALSDITGETASYPPAALSLIYLGWFLLLAGLGLVLYGLNKDEKWTPVDPVPTLNDPKKFLFAKLVLWIPALAVMFLICCLSVVMPFGSPVMNIPFMGSIAGYGITMLIVYRFKGCRGTTGKLPPLSFGISKPGALRAFGITVLLCVAVWYGFFAGMYRLVPPNARLFWLIFATLMMTLGYFVSGCEGDMLKIAGAGKGVIVCYNLIQYVPLFLLTAGYLVIASYSGLIGQVQNMVIMYVFSIPLGSFVRNKTGNRLYGALISAFTFQTAMITSSALIALF